jgi:tellurite resistance protein
MALSSPSSPIATQAAAELLAIVVAANGSIDACELAELERLRAFERLRLTRARFLRMADAALEDIGLTLSRRRWLGARERSRILALQLQVRDRAEQLTVARLAAAVITADGRVTPDERQVYGALLAAWGLSHGMVAHAIMADKVH